MKTLFFLIIFLIVQVFNASAQMPPPGFERAKKMQEERNKLSRLDRDSITMVDTVMVFDPETYESEVMIISSRRSLRDYCITVLGMANPEILLDGNPHTIIDPKTYEDLTIRLNASGKIDTIPK